MKNAGERGLAGVTKLGEQRQRGALLWVKNSEQGR
jgi:hypothetical protein